MLFGISIGNHRYEQTTRKIRIRVIEAQPGIRENMSSFHNRLVDVCGISKRAYYNAVHVPAGQILSEKLTFRRTRAFRAYIFCSCCFYIRIRLPVFPSPAEFSSEITVIIRLRKC